VATRALLHYVLRLRMRETVRPSVPSMTGRRRRPYRKSAFFSCGDRQSPSIVMTWRDPAPSLSRDLGQWLTYLGSSLILILLLPELWGFRAEPRSIVVLTVLRTPSSAPVLSNCGLNVPEFLKFADPALELSPAASTLPASGTLEGVLEGADASWPWELRILSELLARSFGPGNTQRGRQEGRKWTKTNLKFV